MTLYELSLEYEHTAAALRERIVALERERREADSEQRRLQLDGRLRPLRSMYRDTREVARHLKGYYDKQAQRRPVRPRSLWERKRRG